jgi:pimeloyl-ACP methyl ester carboxylesterase
VRRVDVGGYHLAYERGGAGTPVIFLSSLGSDASGWGETVERTELPIEWLVYDRAGIGSSDDRPETTAGHGYRARAEELARLIRVLDFPTPAVLVGISVGALIARAVATTRPDCVAGLVLVEPSVDTLTMRPDDEPPRYDGREPLDAAEGLADLSDERPVDVPAAVVSANPLPGSWPYQRHPPEIAPLWHANQQRVATMYHAQHLLSQHGGHRLDKDDPALIAHAIDCIVRRAREAARPLSAETPDGLHELIRAYRDGTHEAPS